MSVFQFILASLACYRLTVLVSLDNGPWKVMKKVRSLSPRWLGCPYCFSVTAAALIELGFFLSGIRDTLMVSACIVLAMSAVTIIFHRVFSADYAP